MADTFECAMSASPFAGKADAYLEWAFQTNFKHVHTVRDSIGLLVKWQRSADKKSIRSSLETLKIWLATPYYEASICTLSVKCDDIRRFLHALGESIEALELATPISPTDDKDIEHAAPYHPPPGEVLLGLLDDGCPFANSRFMRAGKTRVWRLWDQNENSLGAPLIEHRKNPPGADFAYGGQWSNAELSASATPPDRGEGAYRRMGLHSLRRRSTHGAHVMDLLLEDHELPLVFVQFPQAGLDDPSGRWMARHILDGIHYVLRCAGQSTTKVVLNISWGTQTGPHDGSSLLEQAIDDLVDAQAAINRKLFVVFAAGNHYRSQAHGVVEVAKGCTDLGWHVPPDGIAPAFLELWWPNDISADMVQISITAPDGQPLRAEPGVTMGESGRWSITLIDSPRGGAMALVAVAPTGAIGDTASRAPHGIWRVSITSIPNRTVGEIHLYVARSEHMQGSRRRTRPSYLHDKYYDPKRSARSAEDDMDTPDSNVRRTGTLNGLATGRSSLVAAGYTSPQKTAAPYSSSGPTRGTRTTPDWALETDKSPAIRGIYASGVRSGTKVRLIGTSMAAPQLARELALAGPPQEGQKAPEPDPRLGYGARESSRKTGTGPQPPITTAPATPAPTPPAACGSPDTHLPPDLSSTG